MNKMRTAMIVAVAALLVSSVAFAYGPGPRGAGGCGMRWMAMDCDDGGPWMGRHNRDGHGRGSARNREMTTEERNRMDEFRRARLELQAALAERPVDGKKVTDLQDKLRDLRWKDTSIPDAIRDKMAELHKSALELKLALTEKPVDAKKATSLHERVLELRGEIARWRLNEEIKTRSAN